jgi:hypothetical protein
MNTSIEDKINSLTFLLDTDKSILYKGVINNMDCKIIQTMSFFSKNGCFKKLDEYDFFETTPNEEIFFLKDCFGIFVDKDKKIVIPNGFFFSYDLDHFIQYLIQILPKLDEINLNNDDNKIIDIGKNIIYVEKWFDFYGHFMDEMFILCDFYQKNKCVNDETFICLNSYTNPYEKQEKQVNNFDKLCSYLFKDNYINACVSTYKNNILKMKNIKLVIHSLRPNYQHTFHNFPKQIRDKIYLETEKDINNLFINKYNNIFITRGKAHHLPRNLNNQKELEIFLETNNYFLLNPEDFLLEIFINTVRNAENIFMTWGSALVNMVYFKPKTNVFILKSKSYIDSGETIALFQKIVDTYELNITIIDCNKENIIDTSLLKPFL